MDALLPHPLATAEFLVVDTETNGLAGEACELTEVGELLGERLLPPPSGWASRRSGFASRVATCAPTVQRWLSATWCAGDGAFAASLIASPCNW